MTYILISTQLQLECGPTRVGDEEFDPELASFLEATLKRELGYNYGWYETPMRPRLVLNKLASKGFRVVASAGTGQTCTWTLFKEDEKKN